MFHCIDTSVLQDGTVLRHELARTIWCEMGYIGCWSCDGDGGVGEARGAVGRCCVFLLELERRSVEERSGQGDGHEVRKMEFEIHDLGI